MFNMKHACIYLYFENDNLFDANSLNSAFGLSTQLNHTQYIARNGANTTHTVSTPG